MRIARHIAAVAEIRVEIEEVCKDQAPVREFLQGIECRVEMRHIVCALDLFAGKAMRENIADFADRHGFSRRAHEPFEKIAGQRGKPKILAVWRADEAAAWAPFERPRDHAADVERVAEAPRDLAQLIEPVAAKNGFMRGDLQNRIRRRVADWRLGPNVLGAETLDDLDSRRMAIAEDARKPALGDQGRGQLGRKARLGFWKIPPGLQARRPGDFPMAGRRILARRALDPKTPEPAGWLRAREAKRQDSGRGLGGETKTQGVEIRDVQGSAALGAGRRDMAERIGARITKAGSVFGAAAANRIENEEECAGQGLGLLVQSRAGHGLDLERRREKRPRIGAARVCQKVHRGAGFDDLAVAHDDDFAGERTDHFQIMADEEISEAAPLL